MLKALIERGDGFALRIRKWPWRLAAIVLSAMALLVPRDASAQVSYLQICSGMGTGYFYVPGTSDCLNASQISSNQYGLARDYARALTGVTMNSAVVTPFIPDNARFAVSAHWAVFENITAVGLAGAMRLVGNWSLSAGVGLGLDRGSVMISTVQPTAAGPYRPLESWSNVDVLATMGVNYAW